MFKISVFLVATGERFRTSIILLLLLASNLKKIKASIQSWDNWSNCLY